jgi:VCBS repeat-containing protein
MVNDSTVEMNRMKDGEVVQTVTRVSAADGKTLTFTVTGVNPNGQQINNLAVYDKQ